MFRKLLKYEFLAFCRDLLPIYLLMIAAAVVSVVLLNFGNDLSITVSILVLGAIAIAAVVLTLGAVGGRFQKNLLKDEGYLMLTLPVSVTQIIGSKLLAAVVWCAFGAIAGFISGMVFLTNQISLASVGKGLSLFFRYAEWGDWLMLFTLIGCALVFCGVFVLAVYFAFSVGQLCNGRMKPGLVRSMIPFVCFIGTYIVYSSVWKGICACGAALNVHVSLVDSSTVQLSATVTLAFALCFGIALFLGTRYLLSHHLNLE